jgi:glucose-1-phosphate adenylyltransferase
VFGADHIYRMDLRQMIQHHLASRAEVSVAARPVPLAEASSYGVMTAAADGRITAFAEKPRNPEPMPGDPRSVLGSMGNYLFSPDVLVDVLREDATRVTDHDFGRTIVPELLRRHRVFAYNFRQNAVTGVREYEEPAYWRDVGTIAAYYAANMDLLGKTPPFDLDNPRWPIFARSVEAPPARVISGEIADSLFGEGCLVDGARVTRSILGRGVRIAPGAVVEDAILLDYCEVGEGAVVRRSIVDRFNHVPARGRVTPDVEALDGIAVHRDAAGIAVVPRGEPAGPLPL